MTLENFWTVLLDILISSCFFLPFYLNFDDRALQSKIEDSDSLLSSLKKSLAEKEEKFAADTLKLKRALEEEEFNKVMAAPP